MADSSSEFQTKILRRSVVPDEYELYRAALEWDLTDPIVIESRKDLKSEKRWQNQLQPYHHQVTNLITFCRRLPVTLLADDVGLGKTISAGLVASELIARARVSSMKRTSSAISTASTRRRRWRCASRRRWKNGASAMSSCSPRRPSRTGCGTFIHWSIC